VILLELQGPEGHHRPSHIVEHYGSPQIPLAIFCGITYGEGGTSLGLEAKSISGPRELVPDELMYGIVAHRLRDPDMPGGLFWTAFPGGCPGRMARCFSGEKIL